MKFKKNRQEKITANSLSCKDCCREMGDYIDGKLSLDEDVLFVSHIRNCKECREEFHNYFNFMTNLYFLNFGDTDKFPATEEELLKETESIMESYKKRRSIIDWVIIGLLFIILVLVSFIVYRQIGGYFS